LNFLSNQMKSKVNIGARIYAALLLVYNTMTLISYYNILQTPDVLRTVSDNMSLQMSEEQIQSILAEIPMQLVISGVVIVFQNKRGVIKYCVKTFIVITSNISF